MMTNDDYAKDNGFSDAKSMREYAEEFGTIDTPLHKDTVVLNSEKYEYLLWLTTPKPIETAPFDEIVLIRGDGGWVDGMFKEASGWVTLFGIIIFDATHWLPSPNTPMPKSTEINQLSDDAQDAMGR